MIKLSFSAVSHIGQLSEVNDDRIYANGKFTGSQEIDNVQLSFEGSDKQFIFAVSEGMEDCEEDAAPGISVTEELVKFQKKARNSIKDMQYKLEEMTGCVEQLNNLLYSMTIGDETKKGKKTALAGIIIDGDKAAAINLGSCRVYKLEPENLRPLANDYKRTERLLKMGIITDEQAEQLAGQLGVPKSDSLSQVRKSDIFRLKENDILLICSNGLTEAVSEEIIFEIMSSDGASDEIAGMLVKEAVKSGAADNVTAAVLRVLSTDEESVPARSTTKSISGRINKLTTTVGKKKMDSAKLVSTAVMFVIIAAVVFGIYSLFMSLVPKDKGDNTLAQNGGENTAAVGSNEKSSDEEASTGGDASTGQQDSGKDTGGGDTANTKGSDSEVSGAATTYTIKKGDSLYTISNKFYGDSKKYKLIMEANNIKDPNKIRAGQELTIPANK